MGDVKVNPNGVNAAIRYHVLDAGAMEAAGFRLTCRGDWYYFRSIVPKYDISFGVLFPAEGGSPDDLRIDVLDEEFGQPYDYQHMLAMAAEHGSRPNRVALMARDAVEDEMERLQSLGILSGHERGAYI